MYPYSVNYFGGRLAFIWCLLLLAPFVIQMLQASSNGWPVKVNKRHEIDSCGVTSSDLPTGDIRALSYHLLLDVDLDAPRFAGLAQVSMQINNQTDIIVLNADESLELEEIWYKNYGRISENGKDGEQIIKVKDACLNTQHQILVLNLDQKLEADTLGELNFVYLAKYSQHSDGLFKMSYQDKSGKTRRVVISELEPRPELSLARKLFPCFDHPQQEAFINLDVARRADVKVRSNSEPISDTEMLDGTGRKLIKFDRTVPIAPQKLYLTLSD